MIEKSYVCEVCGKLFKATQPAKYCTPSCKFKKRYNTKETCSCLHCGKLFTKSITSPRKFCSNKCLLAHTKDSPKIKRTCIHCGLFFYVNHESVRNSRCSSCIKKMKNMLANNNAIISSRDIDAYCLYNNIHVLAGEARSQVSLAQTYVLCLTRLLNNARRRLLYAKKKALGLLPKSNGKLGTKIRLKLLNENPRCVICGYSRDIDGLDIHHIDQDRQNNSLDNLIVLCCNCHNIIHRRIRKKHGKTGLTRDKVVSLYLNLKAEVKEWNEAGKDRVSNQNRRLVEILVRGNGLA